MEQIRLTAFRKPRTGELITFKNKQYYVSEDGQVYDGTRKRYVAQYENAYGYKSINLKDDEGTRHTNIGVHRLVASVFKRLLSNGEEVHHRNHNRQDNRLENIEIIDGGEHSRIHNIEKWRNGTFDGVAAKASERTKKAWAAGAHECHGEKISAKFRNVGTNKPAKQVIQLSLDGKLVKVWPSSRECQRNGFYHSAVSRCCNGKLNSYKGFRWQWYEDFLKKQEKEEAQQLELSFSE